MMMLLAEALWKSKVDQLEEEDQSKLKFQRPPKWLANHKILVLLIQTERECLFCFVY